MRYIFNVTVSVLDFNTEQEAEEWIRMTLPAVNVKVEDIEPVNNEAVVHNH